MKTKIAMLGGALMLTACASSPQDIAPAMVSDAGYQNWSCALLDAEQVRVARDLETVSRQQQHARTIDAVGVGLVGLPVASIFGAGHRDEVAQLKGEKNAVARSMEAAQCGGADAMDAPIPQR